MRLDGPGISRMPMPRKPSPSDVGDEEWALANLHLRLMRADAEQRTHDLRLAFGRAVAKNPGR